MRREVYRRSDLSRLIAPARVALVGASPNATSFAGYTLNNSRNFAGTIDLVNPRYEEITGRRCYPSVKALPVAPDCVVIAVPRDGVEDVVNDCVAAGVGGVVIYSSGFAEVGDSHWQDAQRRLGQIARETGLRIIGPNTAGFSRHAAHMALTFTPDFQLFEQFGPAIGIVSQSGGLANGLTQAGHRGVSISHSFASGNACDVDVADFVAYLAEEPECRAIALTFEGLESPERLLQAGMLAWENDKPLIVYKSARGVAGAAAAASHSGYLAGSHAAYRALFDRMGAIEVDSHEALIDTASFFAKAGQPKGGGIAVLANSGGAAIIASDEAEAHGVAMPEPSGATRETIAAAIPDFGAVRNPVDMTAQLLADSSMLGKCADALFSDPKYAAVLWPYLFVRAAVIERRRTLSRYAAQHGKLALFVWMSGWLEGPGAVEAERDPNTAVFRSMDLCMAAVAAWQRRAARRGQAADGARLSDPGAAEAVQTALRDVATATVTESEAKRIFGLYGVQTVAEIRATTAQQAADAAATVGLPVVVKVESPDLPHKSEAGAVRLGLMSGGEVRDAFDTVMANARAYSPDARLDGVVVQHMMKQGVEVMVGGRVDEQFGPLVVVALGGVLVELLADSVTGLAPVSVAEAERMLGRLKGARLFDGFRGSAPVDRRALAETIARLSEFIADTADLVSEFDVNPLICAGSDIVAVDGLIVPTAGGA